MIFPMITVFLAAFGVSLGFALFLDDQGLSTPVTGILVAIAGGLSGVFGVMVKSYFQGRSERVKATSASLLQLRENETKAQGYDVDERKDARAATLEVIVQQRLMLQEERADNARAREEVSKFYCAQIAELQSIINLLKEERELGKRA